MVGRKINGYNLVEFKGKGSFGSVYKCIKDNSIYAMKIFNADYIAAEFTKEDNRIIREIEALKLVDSEYVVKYVDDGRFTDNYWEYVYVVMDYLEGEDLKSVLASRTLSVQEAIQIFSSILDGISAIHKANLVHRDLKPENIYLQNDGSVKILDFGLSKLIDFTSITSTGKMLGSPLYMSPEQIKDSKNVNYRSDYYALGVILFKLLSNESPYGQISLRDELFNKISTVPPLSIRFYIPTIDNSIDNLINELLQKEVYKRPNSVEKIKEYLSAIGKSDKSAKAIDVLFKPSFYLRLWNEKTVLEEFYADGYRLENAIFPINHQYQQKGLLQNIKNQGVNYFLDPATIRLAYDSYADTKGLLKLPYAPKSMNRLEIEDLSSYESKKDYVKLVIDEQLQHKPHHVVSPFHVSNNSNLVKIKMDTNENWFSLDIKLLNESRDYLLSKKFNGDLIGGFCIKTDILTSKTEREYFLNILTSLNCDSYWIYVDCIKNNSNLSQLYNYANSLLELQKSSGKPVIAGRIGPFGLVLLAFGLYAFESGASRFETFYEDLYKEKTDPYNMYIRYYIPELFDSIAIDRKNPAKIIELHKGMIKHDINCSCPYCNSRKAVELVNDKLAKKHFLFRRNEEIEILRDINSIAERVNYMEKQIKNAIMYYKEFSPIFKDEDSSFLRVWLEVIKKLKQDWV